MQAYIPESTYNDILKETYDASYKPEYNGVKFDPDVHLQYYADEIAKHKFENTRRLTMEELGISSKNSISRIGVSDPFPLFTPEAVAIMKQEALEKETFLKYARFNQFSKSGKDCLLRGFVKVGKEIICPFTYEAWTHVKTQELINAIAGVDLDVIMDYEIAHTNISMKSKEDAAKELKEYDASKGDIVQDDFVVGWHRDSYPMVCVLMLSDTTKMIGGSTSLKTGNGVISVPGPTLGSACILQGGLIEHIAPNPKGVSERITMVTSYKKKGNQFDTSSLSTVKPESSPGSVVDEFYADWCGYRNQMIINNLQGIADDIRENSFNSDAIKAKYMEIQQYLVDTYAKMGFNEEDIEKMREQYTKKY
ncbi:hypothetical protein CLIB1444_02S16688 [[Candida] jaroonii]|uniref:Uncharacterized protein n=1 Tax=[Candida] jaroonii TaxID=467808 RepID=A0ACA9Y4D2_9ASCO|nr:hypothetical protein CLIB1444_02S16688 [[Candida] jaroonii]